jgi:hypothetical protein
MGLPEWRHPMLPSENSDFKIEIKRSVDWIPAFAGMTKKAWRG